VSHEAPTKEGLEKLKPYEEQLRAVALAFPEAKEDLPWGHSAFKVKGKTFMFMALSASGLGFSVKLPESAASALTLPFTEPMGYGLGKSGWVSANFKPGDPVPVALVKSWLLESYRAVAPKKLSAQLSGEAPKEAKAKRATSKTATRRAAAKRSTPRR
jgi:predicted DNA-binding protein (MmcQ/YjbR family)